jgi:hypothetical protein
MMNYFADAAFEFEAPPPETILLEESHIERARQLTRKIPNESRRWQSYLNALALFAFEEWFLERAPELTVESDNCTIFQAQYANAIEAVCNLKIGEFKLCLVAMGSLTDRTIAIPRAAIDLPEFSAHFYVVVEVIEELEQATIQGFVRYDNLMEYCRLKPLQAESNWTYRLPMAWFERNSDELLHCLRFVKTAAIALPPIPTHPPATPPEIQAELEALLPQLQSPECKLWDVLSWEQGAALLANSELLDRLLLTPSRVTTPETIVQHLKEPIVNVGLWLRDEIDEFAQKLSWVLLPTFAPEAVPLRSPTQELEVILQQLERSGTNIPQVARGAYSDFKLSENSLRLYAVTWPKLSPDNQPAWTLLLILGATPGTSLQYGVRLLLRDKSSVLLERVLEPNTDETYLYAQVAGTWDEVFTVTAIAARGESLTLPPFVFCPNS